MDQNSLDYCTLGRANLLKFGLTGSAVFFFNAIICTYNEINKKKYLSYWERGLKILTPLIKGENQSS